MCDASLPHVAPIKGIVVVHGAGTARQSSALMYIGQPLLNWVQRWMKANRPQARVRFEEAGLLFRRTDNDAARPPSHVTLRVVSDTSDMDGTTDEKILLEQVRHSGIVAEELHWVVVEVWWSTNSLSPDIWQTAVWLSKTFFAVLGSLVGGIWHRIHDLVIGNPVQGKTENGTLIAWQEWLRQRFRPQNGSLRSFPWQLFCNSVDLLNAIVQVLLFLLIVVVCVIPIILLVLLTLIPIRPVQQFVLVNLLRTWVSANIGEMYTLLEDEIQAANIRARLEQAIQWLVAQRECEQVYVIAHSAGAIVGLETLCRHADQPALARRVTKFLTVGAGLNKAWTLKSDQWRLFDGLTAGIRWVDFWSAYDPVPAGPVKQGKRDEAQVQPKAPARNLSPAGFFRKLRKGTWGGRYQDSVNRAAKPGIESTSVEAVEVTNWMSLLSDHTGYWTNEEQVLSRLAQEIDKEDYRKSRFWPQHDGQAKLVTDRERRISVRAGTRLLALLLCITAVANHLKQVQGWVEYVWHYISTAPIISALVAPFASIFSVLPAPVQHVVFGLGAAVGIGLASLVAYQPARLVLDMWDRHAYGAALQPGTPPNQPATTFPLILARGASLAWQTRVAVLMIAVVAGMVVANLLVGGTLVRWALMGAVVVPPVILLIALPFHIVHWALYRNLVGRTQQGTQAESVRVET